MRRSKHNLSHSHLTTTNMGNLIPIACQEVLAGDTFRMSTSALIRVTPLVNPLMHPVRVRIASFFVPNRLTWPEFYDFLTGRDPAAVVPSITFQNNNGLAGHMGITTASGTRVSALPFYAYNKIWNEHYREDHIQIERALDDVTIARTNWDKDYFTSAKPYAQTGEAISVPISIEGQTLPGLGLRSGAATPTTFTNAKMADGQTRNVLGWAMKDTPTATAGEANLVVQEDPDNPGFPYMYADGSDAGSIDVNAMREAFAMQRFAEARARFGDEDVDYLRYLGMNPQDGRFQRSEYLGGGSQTIAFSEVLSTAEAGGKDVGDMTGHGIATIRTKPFRFFAPEHGFIITLLTTVPKGMYMQAMPRKFQRWTKEDYWQKELEILPSQPILQSEIYAQAPDPTAVFGYVDRYGEYRREFSYVSGEFRNLEKDWHYARDFASAPVLNDSFLQCVPTDRVYAATDVDELNIMASHNITAQRLVSSTSNVGGRSGSY
ncbi:MAG: major capsid protein [Arizlama microvirus]|nr:MAG: major capsid protein [Arizlama microvirus]